MNPHPFLIYGSIISIPTYHTAKFSNFILPDDAVSYRENRRNGGLTGSAEIEMERTICSRSQVSKSAGLGATSAQVSAQRTGANLGHLAENALGRVQCLAHLGGEVVGQKGFGDIGDARPQDAALHPLVRIAGHEEDAQLRIEGA